MKTMKHLLLVLIAIASLGSAKSQCNVFIWSAPNGPEVAFNAYPDSAVTLTGGCWWDFGDGDTAHQWGGTHTYTSNGPFNACFYYFTTNGCSGVVCDTVSVDLCNFNPQITSTVNGYVANLSVYSPPANATFSWTVYTGGGNTLSSTSANPQFTLPGYGSFLATVAVTLQSGCVDSGYAYIDVTNPCASNFYTTNYGYGTYNFYKPDSLGTLSWNLGDGTTSTQNNVTHTYSTNGTYEVCLTRTNGGCTTTSCDTIVVNLCNFNPQITAYVNYYTVNFGLANPQSGATYNWTFTGGTPATSTSGNPQVTFPSVGTYTAHVEVTLLNGCVDTTSTNVYIAPPNCLNYINHQDLGLGQVNFFAVMDSGAQSGYTWDFGDGTTGSGMQATHTYTNSGTYVACATYTGPYCAGTLCDSLVIDVCNLNGGIGYSVNGNTVTFSTYNLTNVTYQWILNDATPSSSTSANPTVTYPTYGTYNAWLEVTAASGCKDTLHTLVVIPNPCNAWMGVNQTTDTDFQFYVSPQDSSNPTAYSYVWTFGDGGTSTLANPTHSYSSNGLKNVCVIVTGTGCVDTTCQQINVAPLPLPTFHLTGVIQRGSSNACAATVYLIKDSLGFLSLVNTTATIDSGGANCTGQYWFWNVPQGDYYIKAALEPTDIDYSDYLPTYYGNVLNWANATAITVNNHLYNQNISLIAGVNPGGPGFVGGWVTQGAGLSANGSNNHRALGDPLPNIQINLVTDNDVPVASTFTDANGRYTFSNLALGTYKVYAEEINKVPYSLNVTLTSNNPSQDDVNVTVNSNSAVTGLDDVHDIRLEGVMPNPVVDKTTVGLSLKEASNVRLTLTDVNGRLLRNRTLDLNAGNNQIQLDLSEEPTGIYHLSLTNSHSKKIIRIVKIK